MLAASYWASQVNSPCCTQNDLFIYLFLTFYLFIYLFIYLFLLVGG